MPTLITDIRIAMPMMKNIEFPANEETWKIAECPDCGQACWETPIMREIEKDFPGAKKMCSECYIAEQKRIVGMRPGFTIDKRSLVLDEIHRRGIKTPQDPQRMSTAALEMVLEEHVYEVR